MGVTVLGLVIGLLGCGPLEGEQGAELGTSAGAIRNGTREPQIMSLLPGEILAVGYLATPRNPTASTCSGTLVGPDLVITATHCVPHQTPSEVAFAIGETPAEPVAVFGVRAIYRHPTLDVALLRLDEDARRRVPSLRPIALNTASLDGLMGVRLLGTMVDVAGFGETMDAERFGRYFAEVRLVEVLPSLVVVDGEGRQGLCFGDSGGPLIVDRGDGVPVVAGVEHKGDRTCVGVDLMVRTDVVAAWVAEVLGQRGPSQCGTLDYKGACQGSTAVWCDSDGRVARRDCARETLGCGFVDDEVGFYCLSKGAQAADSAGGETPLVRELPPTGRLEGNCAVGTDGPIGPWSLGLLGLLGLRRRRR